MAGRLTIRKDQLPIYDIVLEHNFDNLIKEFERLNITDKKFCIVTDSNVSKLYLESLKAKLNGLSVYSYVFEAGEEHKNLDTVRDIYEYLILNHFERKDMLIALGGGVVGDTTGFCAATYLRGIDFIQIPTTLLAQVDSSIGGKTGVDFDSYKNMVGAFHMPKLVYINVSTLFSLDNRLFNSGFGEIIKHGLIKDRSYYQWLKDNYEGISSRNNNVLELMIHRSCQIKGMVVENDPTEKGERALLNYGHTAGHAIEKLMKFKLYHGECVAVGMVVSSYISYMRGNISEDEYNDIFQVIKNYGFPVKLPEITAEEVYEVARNDKKAEAGVIKFILLKSIGEAYIDKTVTKEEFLEALKVIDVKG